MSLTCSMVKGQNQGTKNQENQEITNLNSSDLNTHGNNGGSNSQPLQLRHQGSS